MIYKDKIGELTGQEKQELLAWLEESDFNRQIFDELAKGSSLSRSYAEYRNVHREQVWNKIEKQIAPQRSRVSLRCGIRDDIGGGGMVCLSNVG